MLLHLMGSAIDGGAETYFLSLTAALQRAGVAQTVALRPHPAREAALAALGIPYRVFRFARFDPLTRPRVRRYAEVVGARVLLGWMSRAAQHMPPGPWRRIGRHGGYYNLRFYRGCDLLVGNTEDICRSIISRGWPAERVRYIRNFAAIDRLPALPRTSFDTPPGVPLALSMGRLHSDKAHDVTLRALAQLPGAELGVADRVRFLGWREDAGALYRAADICLFPSRVEPLGNVVIQAWAYGLPIITAKSLGPSALVRDGIDGLLVEVDDPGAVARAAGQLLAEPTLAAGLRAAGLARVASEYSEAAVIAEWLEVLGR